MLPAVRRRLRFSNTTSMLALALAVGGGGYAIAASSNTHKLIRACVSRSGTPKIVSGSHCPHGQHPLAWNRQGPTGTPGQTGQRGLQGIQGNPGFGAINIDATVPLASANNLNSQTVTSVDGMTLTAHCGSPQTPRVLLNLGTGSSTKVDVIGNYWTADTPTSVHSAYDVFSADGHGSNVNISLFALSETVRKSVRFDITITQGASGCTVFGMVIPPTS